jgi:hypothetical protein
MRTPSNVGAVASRRRPRPRRISVPERRTPVDPPVKHRAASGMAADLASVVAIVVLLGMLLLQPFTWISVPEVPAVARPAARAGR